MSPAGVPLSDPQIDSPAYRQDGCQRSPPPALGDPPRPAEAQAGTGKELLPLPGPNAWRMIGHSLPEVVQAERVDWIRPTQSLPEGGIAKRGVIQRGKVLVVQCLPNPLLRLDY